MLLNRVPYTRLKFATPSRSADVRVHLTNADTWCLLNSIQAVANVCLDTSVNCDGSQHPPRLKDNADLGTAALHTSNKKTRQLVPKHKVDENTTYSLTGSTYVWAKANKTGSGKDTGEWQHTS